MLQGGGWLVPLPIRDRDKESGLDPTSSPILYECSTDMQQGVPNKPLRIFRKHWIVFSKTEF